jgi:hypothetical protein
MGRVSRVSAARNEVELVIRSMAAEVPTTSVLDELHG